MSRGYFIFCASGGGAVTGEKEMATNEVGGANAALAVLAGLVMSEGITAGAGTMRQK
jgi:hypothetical protein